MTHLPTHPPMCAVCLRCDWTVTTTERDGRMVHFRCSTLAAGGKKEGAR